VKLRSSDVVQQGDFVYVDGQVTLGLPRGQYTFDVDAGPEYRPQNGHFEIVRHADDAKTVQMARAVDLRKEGWWGGDLDVHQPPKQLPLVLRAEGLDLAPVATATSASLATVQDVPEQDAHRVALTPFAWDLPVWVARNDLDAILLINRHSLRDGALDNEGEGRPRDRALFPGTHGNGRWSEAIYYHLLNCGIRVPPAAGSGSGMNDNPVGASRVYVYCGDEFSLDRWWDGLENGRVFVSNGPLLRPLVHGQPPGYVFQMQSGEPLDLEIGLNLATRQKIDYLEIVKNGAVVEEVRLNDWAERKGKLPPLHFDEAGWFLVRAVTDNPKTYQYATTGAYFVEKDGQPRISRRSVQFFLDWLAEAAGRIKEADPAQQEVLSAQYREAEGFWRAMLARANAD
jgi:hypothetical protein